jgi:hypothetical protein
MDTLTAFAIGAAHRDEPPMVFDWIRAAEIIRDEQPTHVEAGLESDLEWTAGTIYRNGEIVTDDYTYLASTWATPLLITDGVERACFVMMSDTTWDAETKWPEEARAILAT